jgi:hypothetical protein
MQKPHLSADTMNQDDPREPYHTPRLTVHGTVQDLTGNVGGAPGDIPVGDPSQ